MKPNALPQLNELESLRGNPVVVFASTLTDDGVRVLYEYLRRRGPIDSLDLVLSTAGGSVNTARRVALLLREYAQYLTILVPYRAWSAGTLLCLGADELVLGPMAELGPIDSHIGSTDPPPPDAPGMISAEDVRAFRQMAVDWFGVDREEDRLQVLALMAQRVFPTSLSSFYRFDKLVRQVAHELLAYQLPYAKPSTRQTIVDKLVGGYHAHNYIISRAEARELGLLVRFASPKEEALLWDLSKACRAQITDHPGETEQEEPVTGLIAGAGFYAQQVLRRTDTPTWRLNGSEPGNTPRRDSKTRSRWLRILRRYSRRYGGTPQPEDKIDDYWEIGT